MVLSWGLVAAKKKKKKNIALSFKIELIHRKDNSRGEINIFIIKNIIKTKLFYQNSWSNKKTKLLGEPRKVWCSAALCWSDLLF